MRFELQSQLIADTVVLGKFPLSLVLLSKDANYPWCILVPQREDVRDLHELDRVDRVSLIEESCILSEAMEALFNPDKMNVAALGNVVPQLHIHHIARFQDDPAWPQPIWGAKAARKYSSQGIYERVETLRQQLMGMSDFKVA